MVNDYLRPEEYVKINQFVESMRVTDDYFRAQILSLLANIFGHNKCGFWLCDFNANLISPVSTLGDQFINEYISEDYSKIDPLSPKNIGINNAIKNQVISIDNIMPAVNYEKTDFCNVLKGYGYYWELGFYLFDTNRIIGGIGIVRPKNEGNFNQSEINTIRVLVKHITQGLLTNQLLFNKEYERKLFESFSNKSSTGMIICDPSLKIYYFNESFGEICHELLANERYNNPTEYFIETFLAPHRSFWKIGYENTFFTNSLKKVKVNVLPTVIGDYGINGNNLFVIMLSYEDNIIKSSFDFMQQSLTYKLTVREREILSLITQGKTNLEIADKLFVSTHTIKKYVRILFDKFDVKNRTSLIAKVINK